MTINVESTGRDLFKPLSQVWIWLCRFPRIHYHSERFCG